LLLESFIVQKSLFILDSIVYPLIKYYRYFLSRLPCLVFVVQFGAVLMRHRGNNGHNGQFSYSLVYCMEVKLP